MEIEDVEIIQMELKYCERCGGLWLRVHGAEAVYCAYCALMMSGLPAALHRRPRRPANHKVEMREDLRGVAVVGEGGNA